MDDTTKRHFSWLAFLTFAALGLAYLSPAAVKAKAAFFLAGSMFGLAVAVAALCGLCRCRRQEGAEAAAPLSGEAKAHRVLFSFFGVLFTLTLVTGAFALACGDFGAAAFGGNSCPYGLGGPVAGAGPGPGSVMAGKRCCAGGEGGGGGMKMGAHCPMHEKGASDSMKKGSDKSEEPNEEQ